MKYLIVAVAFLVLITFSGIYSYLEAHVFAWIPSTWIVYAQTTITIVAVLSIIAYATLYIYYACQHR